jgi:hypothetical protein
VLYLAYDWLFERELKDKIISGGSFKVHATGYWPETASEAEKKMEGGLEGAAAWRGRRVVDPTTGKRVQLHTVEDFLAGHSDHVSISGDPDIFPFGQKLVVNWFDKTIVGRVTDTGGHFHGPKKVYRVVGEEPLDFDVHSSSTPVPKKGVVAQIAVGDHWDKIGTQLVAEKFKGQTVTGVRRAEEIRRQAQRGGLMMLGRRAA